MENLYRGWQWMQELIMLNSKHVEFKATNMWVYQMEWLWGDVRAE